MVIDMKRWGPSFDFVKKYVAPVVTLIVLGTLAYASLKQEASDAKSLAEAALLKSEANEAATRRVDRNTANLANALKYKLGLDITVEVPK